jgi:hypothetical protein
VLDKAGLVTASDTNHYATISDELQQIFRTGVAAILQRLLSSEDVHQLQSKYPESYADNPFNKDANEHRTILNIAERQDLMGTVQKIPTGLPATLARELDAMLHTCVTLCNKEKALFQLRISQLAATEDLRGMIDRCLDEVNSDSFVFFTDYWVHIQSLLMNHPKRI